MMRPGLYRVIATVEFPVYEPDVYLTHQVRAPKIEGLTLRMNDAFRIVQAKTSKADGFFRALIILHGRMASIRVGENIPNCAFERVEEKSVYCS